MKLKYSFLVSIYEKEKPEFFRLSMESMLNQTYKPDEIVLVCDGKLTDALYEVIDEYKKKYPEILTVVPLEKNVGLGLALNEGLKVCRNPLAARMDTDDICMPDRCELQVREFEIDPNLDIIGGMTDEFYDTPDNVVSSRIVPTKHEDIVNFLRRRSPFNHPTVMYKKDKVLEVGGYSDLRRAQDLDLFTRMINVGKCKTKNLDKAVLLFRADRNNLKRRKSFNTCKLYTQMVYGFWKKGYVRFSDFFFVLCYQTCIFIVPVKLAAVINSKFLRKMK